MVGPSGDLTGLDMSSDGDNAVIVLDPPIPLHTRCTIECWVLLPFTPSESSSKDAEEEDEKRKKSSEQPRVVQYRALCGDSDGDIVCCIRQGPSRHKDARDRRREAERVYDDANTSGKKKKKKREDEKLHFGFFLFREDDEEEEDGTPAAEDGGEGKKNKKRRQNKKKGASGVDEDSNVSSSSSSEAEKEDDEEGVGDASFGGEGRRRAGRKGRRSSVRTAGGPDAEGGEEEEEGEGGKKKGGRVSRSGSEARGRGRGGDGEEETGDDDADDRTAEKEYGFFETKRVRLKKKERQKLMESLSAPGWHHFVVTRCESGIEYYWDSTCVGYISNLSLPFSGFLDVETIGNVLEGKHTFGAFSHFTVFSCYMDEMAVKERYAYLQQTFVNKASLGEGRPRTAKSLGDEGKEAGGRGGLENGMDASTYDAAVSSVYGMGKVFPGVMSVDLLAEVIILPASKKRSETSGVRWALCACNPVPIQAVVYRPETTREHIEAMKKLQGRARSDEARRGRGAHSKKRGKGGGYEGGEEGVSDLSKPGLVRCNANGVGGLIYKKGPMAGTSASTAATTINRCCIVLDPPIDIDQEFLQQRGWTVFSWIYTPLPETGHSHVLIGGERDFHVCVLTDQRSLGMAFCTSQGDGASESTGDGEDAASEGSIDSDGWRRDEYPSGLDISELTKGWHLLCVTGSEAGQSYFVDGEMKGHLPKTVWANIKYCGNFLTGNKPWGQFSHVRIYGRPFTVQEIATDYQGNTQTNPSLSTIRTAVILTPLTYLQILVIRHTLTYMH